MKNTKAKKLRRAKQLQKALSLLVLSTLPALSQTPPAENADRDVMYEHFKKAETIAGLDLYPHFARRCLVDQSYRRTIAQNNQAPAAMEPFKVFDNLYFLGQNAVSAWALQTSAGVILFDSLNNPEEAKTYIVGGLEKLGLHLSDVKYIIVTHGHGDHFGGASYLKELSGARIMTSKVDWDAMTRTGGRGGPAGASGGRGGRGSQAAGAGGSSGDQSGGGRGRGGAAPGPPLIHDIDLEDGQKFTLGDTTLTFYITPGHTQGAVSTIFRVTDQGQSHVAALFGGFGTPGSAEDKKKHVASIARFRTLAQAAGVDTLIANHQTQDLSVDKLELLRMRRSGDPNPYVIGKDAYLRYLDVQSECTLYAMAREGQK